MLVNPCKLGVPAPCECHAEFADSNRAVGRPDERDIARASASKSYRAEVQGIAANATINKGGFTPLTGTVVLLVGGDPFIEIERELIHMELAFDAPLPRAENIRPRISWAVARREQQNQRKNPAHGSDAIC